MSSLDLFIDASIQSLPCCKPRITHMAQTSHPKHLLLVDGHSLAYRAFYALPVESFATSSGQPTNAVFGFTSMLINAIKEEKPTHIAIAFDVSRNTFRKEMFPDYKANRQEAPEDLLDSLPHIKAIIEGFNIPVIEYDGYEADDIIGTLAWQAADLGYEVYMVTPDKDYGQLLIHPNVFIWKPPAFGNKEEILTAQKICEKWDIQRVEQVVDMLGLMGDASDNIPGIPGVGEKTAAKLLKEYDTLENVLANADKIKGDKMPNNCNIFPNDNCIPTAIIYIIINIIIKNSLIQP